MSKNKKQQSLHSAKSAANDEFYTQLKDIELEMYHYRNYFKGKHVFLNCDDPEYSNFYRYFNLNFEFLGLKQLTATHYDENKPTYRIDIYPDTKEKVQVYENGLTNTGNKIELLKGEITPLKENGDFRSNEAIDILKESDVVVTNPPFSLFREYIAQLFEYNKDFIVIGNMNAITYKEIFPLIKNNELWLGVTRSGTGSMWFIVPNDAPYKKGQKIENGIKYQTIGNSAWFTNVEHEKRHEKLILTETYEGNEENYPKYDNYNGIEVGKVKNIPLDYEGAMGVPITFLGKYNPDQFELIKFRKGDDEKDLTVNGEAPYFRILIKNKLPEKPIRFSNIIE